MDVTKERNYFFCYCSLDGLFPVSYLSQPLLRISTPCMKTTKIINPPDTFLQTALFVLKDTKAI